MIYTYTPLLTLDQLPVELEGNLDEINALLWQLRHVTIADPTADPPADDPTDEPRRALTKVELFRKNMRLAQICKPIEKDLGR